MDQLKKTYDANTLKLIAILAMTLDHIAWLCYPGYSRQALPLILHVIGRITCPIMCYFVAEGYYYTRNINRYTARLFGFAVISHFAYIYASLGSSSAQSFLPFASGSVFNQTSVMWSLAWGLVMLRVAHSARIRHGSTRVLLILLICVVSFPSDWSCIASLCILAFGTNRGNLRAQMLWMLCYVMIYAVVYCLALDWAYGLLQMAVVLAIPLILRYNGQRGRSETLNRVLKWGFYFYYPLHLFVIGLLK